MAFRHHCSVLSERWGKKSFYGNECCQIYTQAPQESEFVLCRMPGLLPNAAQKKQKHNNRSSIWDPDGRLQSSKGQLLAIGLIGELRPVLGALPQLGIN